MPHITVELEIDDARLLNEALEHHLKDHPRGPGSARARAIAAYLQLSIARAASDRPI